MAYRSTEINISEGTSKHALQIETVRFPFGKGQPNDPTQPVTTLKTAWTKVRYKAKVVGR